MAQYEDIEIGPGAYPTCRERAERHAEARRQSARGRDPFRTEREGFANSVESLLYSETGADMERIGIYDARSRLSELVGRVEAGEEVVLTRRGRAVVRLVRAEEETRSKARAEAVMRIRALRKRMNLRISRAEIRRAIVKGRA